MDDTYKIKAEVIESNCGNYQVGDAIYFDGTVIDKEKSANLCACAISAIFPFILVSRKGLIWENTEQCPDCDEHVKFKIENITDRIT